MVQIIAVAASAALSFAAITSAWQHGPPPKWPVLAGYGQGSHQQSSLCVCSVPSTSKSTSKTSTKTSPKTNTKTDTKTSTHTSVASVTGAASTGFSTSTFLIPTATTANPVATGLSIDDGSEYIQYSTVGGYFLQDLTTTTPGTFDYTATSFGLINQTYPDDTAADANLTQWQRFNRQVYYLNQLAASNVVYKLLFIGRHGEGYHNAAQTFYGTPAWNCFYAEIDGNSTAIWSDAHLDPAGVAQAIKANIFWASQIATQKIQPPQSYYTSPLSRCLETANYTYSNLSLPSYYPFVPTVKEFFREGISIHTCDRRSNRTYIAESFPTYNIDPLLTENDEIWNGVTAETNSAQDYRSKIILDKLFASDPADIVSITTHSGEAASLLRVLGHIPFSLVTGAIIPVLVKAETIDQAPPATTTSVWTTSAWCTNGPPISSQTTGADACVCSGGVQPTAVSPTMTGTAS